MCRRCPIYWTCLGSPRISCFFPVFPVGKVPDQLTGSEHAATIRKEERATLAYQSKETKAETGVKDDSSIDDDDETPSLIWVLCDKLVSYLEELSPVEEEGMNLLERIRDEMATMQGAFLMGDHGGITAHALAIKIQELLDVNDKNEATRIATEYMDEQADAFVQLLMELCINCEQMFRDKLKAMEEARP